MFDLLLVSLLGSLDVLEPGDLIRLQPAGLAREVGEVDQDADADQNGGQRLENEQPLPAFQSPTRQAQQHPGDRRSDDRRNRDRQHEQADHPGAVHGRKPQGQIEDDAGKEAGLAGAEQQTQRIENTRRRNSGRRRYRWDEGEGRRNDPPGDHDACDPDARADLFQEDVGGDFEQEISDEEQSRAQSESGFAQTERLVHVQLGEADIDAIEIGYEIAQDQERNQPRHDLADDTLLDVVHSEASSYVIKSLFEIGLPRFAKL